MELVNMASIESANSELMVIEYVPLEETIEDENIYVVHPYEDGNDTQLYHEFEDDKIMDISAEEFCAGKNLYSSMPHIQRYSYKLFTKYPESSYSLDNGLKIVRTDNCVYLDNMSSVYWKVEVINQNKTGYIKVSDQTISPQHRWCIIATLLRICNFITSYSMIWAIITDILLVTQIYFEQDINFFISGLTFIIIPIFCVEMIIYYMIYTDNEADKIQHLISYPVCFLWTPILNIPLFLFTKHPKIDFIGSLIGMILCGTMTYPLYIINLCFMLENIQNGYQNLSIFNILQFAFAIFTFCVSPFTNLLSMESKFFMMDGIALSVKDKLKLYGIVSFTLIPTLLIEILHFFPILFAYYHHSINYQDFMYMLLLFNIPKFLFIIHMTKKFWTITAFSDAAICGKIIFTFIITFIFLTLPLIPYFIAMLFKDKYKRTQTKDTRSEKTIFFDGICSSTSRYYWNVVAYLWISYGCSSIYLFYIIGLQNISHPLSTSLITILFLCTIITISIPRLFYDFHRYFGE